MKKNSLRVFSLGLIVVLLAGCSFVFQVGRRSDKRTIDELSGQLSELEKAKRLLEKRLSSEIANRQVSLQMKERGLVITVLGDVLFDSGKANIRVEAYPILDKLAVVLTQNVADLNVGIEGHTDNQPIRFSGWKSNWELSTARALSVLHYFADNKGILPERLSAIGYGEYRPVASNATKEGWQLNRRVEIIILPKIAKIKEGEQGRKPLPPKSKGAGELKEPEGKFK